MRLFAKCCAVDFERVADAAPPLLPHGDAVAAAAAAAQFADAGDAAWARRRAVDDAELATSLLFRGASSAVLRRARRCTAPCCTALVAQISVWRRLRALTTALALPSSLPPFHPPSNAPVLLHHRLRVISESAQLREPLLPPALRRLRPNGHDHQDHRGSHLWWLCRALVALATTLCNRRRRRGLCALRKGPLHIRSCLLPCSFVAPSCPKELQICCSPPPPFPLFFRLPRPGTTRARSERASSSCCRPRAATRTLPETSRVACG